MHMHTHTEVTGRFRAVVHKGHTYDADGNIVQEGEVVVRDGKRQETPFGRNKLKLQYFRDILDNVTDVTGCFVAGTGNTTPTESDGTLTAYAGKASVHVSMTNSYSDTPDVDGYIYLRSVFRATFNPGALGSGTKNIAEGGIAKGHTGIVNNLTNLYAHGLLVDDLGAPTTVAVDATNEYLDLFWEYTRYFKAEESGTVTLNILGTDVVHDYVMRPSNFRQQANSANYAWPNNTYVANNISLRTLFRPSNDASNFNTGTGVKTGPIGTHMQLPTDSGWTGARNASLVQAQTRTTDKARTWLTRWITTAGNGVTGNVGCIYLAGNYSPSYQISFDPKLEKTIDRQLDIYFTYSMDNKA